MQILCQNDVKITGQNKNGSGFTGTLPFLTLR